MAQCRAEKVAVSVPCGAVPRRGGVSSPPAGEGGLPAGAESSARGGARCAGGLRGLDEIHSHTHGLERRTPATLPGRTYRSRSQPSHQHRRRRLETVLYNAATDRRGLSSSCSLRRHRGARGGMELSPGHVRRRSETAPAVRSQLDFCSLGYAVCVNVKTPKRDDKCKRMK